MPIPTAPKAKEAYKNGTITTYNWDNTPNIIYQRHLAYPHGIPKEISIVDANDNDFIHPISRKIRREVRMGMYPEGLTTNDTVYIEAPRHNGIVTPKYRVASTYKPNGEEYEILKKRFNEAKSVSNLSKKQQGGQLNMNKQELEEVINQIGGKYRRPFTGFEGLTYKYEAPDHSLQGRAQRPEIEDIYNNGELISSKETWYDPEIYNNTGKLQIEDQGYFIGDGAEMEWEPTEQQKRIFNSLKRHALMNQYFKEQRPYIFQQGGQLNMNEQQLQQAFIQFLAQKTGAKTQQELEEVIKQLGEDGVKQAYAEFIQMLKQRQVQAAKFGAKIEYIKGLRGLCPEGYNLQYYKKGGRLCKTCIKKQQGGDMPTNPIDAFKCGRKMRKKKCENGGNIMPNTKKKVTYPQQQDQATRDSIEANKHNNQDIMINRPGNFKKNKQGVVQWTPDRTKYPYNKQKNK